MGQIVCLRVILQPPPQRRPSRGYCSGSSIEGQLIAEIAAPVTVERVSVRFSGKGSVNCTNEASRSHFSCSSEVYCDEEQILVGLAERGIGPSEYLSLPSGNQSFPFRFTIPSSAPSSIEGSGGYIRYEVQGFVTMSDQSRCCSQPVVVTVNYPVNVAEPHLLQPKCQEVQKTVSFFPWTSSPLSMAVTVPKTGYCVGEEMPLKVSFENGSRRSIYLTASVDELIAYSSQGGGATPVVDYGREQTVVRVKSDAMASKSTHEWNPTIKIPVFPVEDTHTSQIIQLSYLLTVTAVVSRSHSERNLRASIPLKLGHEQHLTNTASQSDTSSDVWPAQQDKELTVEETKNAATDAIFDEPPPSPSAPPQSLAGLPTYQEAVAQCTHGTYY